MRFCCVATILSWPKLFSERNFVVWQKNGEEHFGEFLQDQFWNFRAESHSDSARKLKNWLCKNPKMFDTIFLSGNKITKTSPIGLTRIPPVPSDMNRHKFVVCFPTYQQIKGFFLHLGAFSPTKIFSSMCSIIRRHGKIALDSGLSLLNIFYFVFIHFRLCRKSIAVVFTIGSAFKLAWRWIKSFALG